MPEVWREKNLYRQIFILNSKCLAKEFRKMIKHLIAYLIYSQIWLKLPKDDRHFGYKQKSLKKRAAGWRTVRQARRVRELSPLHRQYSGGGAGLSTSRLTAECTYKRQ